MVSEEINLNHFLEKKGYRVVETDLGEWIIQLAGERPSHITAPALHKTKEEIDDELAAKVVKDVILLNKGIAKKLNFETSILSELYRLLWGEKVMPFNLDQWVFDEV